MKDTAFLQATFHGTNREYSYPNKEYIDLIFVSLIVFLIDKYHKTISPESEVYNNTVGTRRLSTVGALVFRLLVN